MTLFKMFLGFIGTVLFASWLLPVVLKPQQLLIECQEKFPHTQVKLINNKCHYSTEWGWVLEGKEILKPKVIIKMKQKRI
jgi:hypothetical protein